jgi:tetratricopeptide (TPR) repeat protein
VRRALLLTALLCAYGAFAFRGIARGALQRGAFDPLLPLARAVEQRIGDTRFAEALPVALELQHAYPTEPLVAYWLARIHHGLNNSAAEAEAWEQYVALSPAPSDACPAWPQAYTRLHRAEQAVSTYERCVRLAPEDANLLMDLGDAYAAGGRRDDSRAAFERAARLEPDNPLPGRRLAVLRETAP